MASKTQRTLFIGYRDSGDEFVYMELDLIFEDGQAPEWLAERLVERLPDNRFRPWRYHGGIEEPGIASYVAHPACDEKELITAGYADCLRVTHPDTAL